MGSIDGKNMGIMPANYLKILGKKLGDGTSQSQFSEQRSHSN